MLLLMGFANKLPVKTDRLKDFFGYCTGPSENSSLPLCLSDGFGGYLINWQLWWKDVFVWLSIIGIFGLLVVGTYMLIDDLSKEEHRGTLNFLRLTPVSNQSILIGKLLGVPIILYLVVFLALPLHWAAGFSGQIPLNLILGFYSVLGASCLFFYSAALLFGLVGNWLGGFQAWLGSGMVLIFLSVITSVVSSSHVNHYATDWLTLFNPSVLVPYLIGSDSLNAANPSEFPGLSDLPWFGLPISASVWSLAGFMVLNYGLWTYWIWQGLNRCFDNPSATLLGKQQSYWLTASFEAVIFGFALNPPTKILYPIGVESPDLLGSLNCLLVFNLLLFLCLIVAVCPQRQALQDWARYRHQKRSSRKGGVMSDLIWGEKSPVLVAVVMNVAIASAILLPWILIWPQSQYKTPGLWALLLNMSLVLVYAAVAQLMLFMKTPKRVPWAAATVGFMIVLPPIIFGLLSMEPSKNPGLWLFSAFPWAAVEHTTAMSVFLAIIGQSLALGVLSVQLTRQLGKAGESSTKALLSEHRVF
jgi:ABC-type transport system involved in multi-copper enzyme maturation permease subunit